MKLLNIDLTLYSKFCDLLLRADVVILKIAFNRKLDVS